MNIQFRNQVTRNLTTNFQPNAADQDLNVDFEDDTPEGQNFHVEIMNAKRIELKSQFNAAGALLRKGLRQAAYNVITIVDCRDEIHVNAA